MEPVLGVPTVVARALPKDEVLPTSCLWNMGPFFPAVPVSHGRRLLICAEFMMFSSEVDTYIDFLHLNSPEREVIRLTLGAGLTYIEYCPREILVKSSGYSHAPGTLPLSPHLPMQALVLKLAPEKQIMPLYTITNTFPFRLVHSYMREYESWSYNAPSHLHVPHKVLHLMELGTAAPTVPLYLGEGGVQESADVTIDLPSPYYFPTNLLRGRYRLEVVNTHPLPSASLKQYTDAALAAYESPYAT